MVEVCGGLGEAELRSYLDGYHAADGSYDERCDGRSYHSSSARLLREVRSLHIELGDRVSNMTTKYRNIPIVIKGIEVKVANPIHTFTVYSRSKERHKTLLGQYGLRRVLGDTFSVERVLEVVDTGEVDDTYDIEVTDDHCFIVEGMLAKNCSELVEWAASRCGIYIVDGSNAQYRSTQTISVANAKATRGALLFSLRETNTFPEAYHVGISLGNGRVVEAANTKVGVVERSASYGSWQSGGLIKGMVYNTTVDPRIGVTVLNLDRQTAV